MNIRMFQDPEEKPPDNFGLGRLLIIIVPSTATMALLALRLSRPLSWGLSAFAWVLIAYWLRPKPQQSFGLWIIVSIAFALATSLIAMLIQM